MKLWEAIKLLEEDPSRKFEYKMELQEVVMKPKNTKREIDLLIDDIQDNEWYCIQGGSESELKDWEKNLIVIGLRKLLED